MNAVQKNCTRVGWMKTLICHTKYFLIKEKLSSKCDDSKPILIKGYNKNDILCWYLSIKTV